MLSVRGEVAYHLMLAAHATRAPWPVTVLVACLPLVTLHFGAALTHLLRSADAVSEPDATPTVETARTPRAAAPVNLQRDQAKLKVAGRCG